VARRVRRNHGAAFKAKVALELVRGEKTLNEFPEPALTVPVQFSLT